MIHQENWSHAVEGDPCWISDPDQAYLEATILSVSGDNVTVQTKGGKRFVVDVKAALNPLQKPKPGAKKGGKAEEPRKLLPRSLNRPAQGVENMDDLYPLNAASILSNIELRFRLDNIYTRTGPILIAMNPFKWLPIYGDEIIRQYHTKPYGMLPPHVFQEAEDAYQLLQVNNENQAVIICGESGAGKTETTKLMLQYLSTVARADDEPADELTLGDQMVQSNPLLEAFGNAKTVRNNNSSRFGKFTVFSFDEHGFISGGRISSFLLEKVRTVKPSKNERNYHIFYQLCAGASDHLRDQFHLLSPDRFSYLSGTGCMTVDGVDDAEEFGCTVQSMQAVGITDQEQLEIFKVTAAILHLGNIEFVGSSDMESSRAKDMSQVNVVSTMLGLDPTALATALVTRVRQVPSGTVTSQQTMQQSVDSRDALAKAVYSKLFDWIVGRVNVVLEGDTDPNDRFIGILDIFGFEDMNENGFEQLFINYTNETLQRLFNDAMFKKEEEEYRRENIDWNRVEFPDNEPCLELLEKKPLGLFPFMDSECARGAAAGDKSLVLKWHKAHKAHSHYGACGPSTPWRRKDGSMTEEHEFVIKHFTGPVIYVCNDFIEKNRDALYDHVYDVLSNSNSDLVKVLFPVQDARNNRSASDTVATRFTAQLNSLTQTLRMCNTRFVRCIKSNQLLQPQVIDKPNVLNQLICSGVMAALEVRRAGYPTRLLYDNFVPAFRMLLTHKPPQNLTLRRTFSQIQLAKIDQPIESLNSKELTARAMTHPAVLEEINAAQYRLGKTKIFLQADVLSRLEGLKNRILLPFVYRLQRWWLKIGQNILAHKLKRAVTMLAEAISLAEVSGVQNVSYVRDACEGAMAAVRYAKGIGLFNTDVFRPALATAMEKTIEANQAVHRAKKAKEEEAQQRAELLQELDASRARLSRVSDGARELSIQSEELKEVVAEAAGAIDKCRIQLLRAANREAVSAVARGDPGAAQASVELKRTFTKAVLQLEESEGEEDFAYVDLDERRERVAQASQLVDEAEDIYQGLLAEQMMLDQARHAYQANLDASIQAFERLREKAYELNIATMVTVENALVAAAEAIEAAHHVLTTSSSIEEFELKTRMAADAVDDAHQVLVREQANKVQEDRRAGGRKKLDTASKKLRALYTEAEVGGVSMYPAVLEAFSAAEEAINQAGMMETTDAREFLDAATYAAEKIEELEKVCAKEKHRKERNDRERSGELQRLQPSIDTLAELQAKIEVGGLSAESGVYGAIMEAAKSMDMTRSLLETTDDVTACRDLVQETIMKVVAAERAYATERQRKDALLRETTMAEKDLVHLEKRLHALKQLSESAGTAIAQLVEHVILEAEHAVMETKRTIRRGEAVGTIRAAVAAAETKIDRAEDYVARQKQMAIQAQKIRANEAVELETAAQTLVQAIEAMGESRIQEIPEVREAVANAEAAVRAARGRLSKPVTAFWFEHDELSRDQAAVREALHLVDVAEDVILSQKGKQESKSRELRANQDKLEVALDRLEALSNMISEHGLTTDSTVTMAMEESEDALLQAKKTLREDSHASMEQTRQVVDSLMQKLQHTEDLINQAKQNKSSMNKEKLGAQNQLDLVITKLQGVVAMVDAAGPFVATMTEDILDEATESVNVATRLLRRGQDIDAFTSAVAAASAMVDQAEEMAGKIKHRVAKATALRSSAMTRLESLAETLAVAHEKTVSLGLRNVHSINSALHTAESVLHMARRRAEGGIDTWIEDGVTISRLVDEATEKVQAAEEVVDEAALRKDRETKDRREADAELDALMERHLAVVAEVDRAGVGNVLAIQQAVLAAERELDSARQSLQAGTSVSLNAAIDRVQEEEELAHIERHKREKREVEMQRAERELPILQRRVAAVTAMVDAAGPVVGILVEPELSHAQKAVRDLEKFMDYGDKFAMAWPTVENADNKVRAAEEIAQRQINRVNKVYQKRREELARLETLQARFSQVSESVAAFCTRSDHLRLQMSADWKDVCWWGSQVKHTYTDGSPIGRGEIKPMSSVQLITEAIAVAEQAIINARKKAEVGIEEWLEVGPGSVHRAIEEAAAKIESAHELVEKEAAKLEREEKERSSAREALDTLLDRLATIRASTEVGGVSEVPTVADSIRAAEHAVEVVANLLSTGNVAASPPAMEVASRKVSEAQEIAMTECQRKERFNAERAHLRTVLAGATHRFECSKETVDFLAIQAVPYIQDAMSRAEKSLSGANLVLKSEFGLAIVSKEVQIAVHSVEEFERTVRREKARREEAASLKSKKEQLNRARRAKEIEEQRRRSEEETRQRRRMQDELDRASHRLNLQAPVVHDVQSLTSAAEAAVEAARAKLANGGLAAATAAVQSAVQKIWEVEQAARQAELWDGSAATQAEQERDVLAEQLGQVDPYAAAQKKGDWMEGYMTNANDYMGRTATAFEAMTTNLHFLTQGLMNVNRAMQNQARMMAIQTSLLTGQGDREALLRELHELQKEGAALAQYSSSAPVPQLNKAPPGARAQMQVHSRSTLNRFGDALSEDSHPARFAPSSTSSGFEENSESGDDGETASQHSQDVAAGRGRSASTAQRAPQLQAVPQAAAAAAGTNAAHSMAYPAFPAGCESLLARYLTRAVFDELKTLQTASGVTLQDCIIPGIEHLDAEIGVVAGDSESYVLFSSLFEPIIAELHPLFTPDSKQEVDQDASKLLSSTPGFNSWLKSKVSVRRNLLGFNLLPHATTEQLVQIETIISEALRSLTGELVGSYHSMQAIATNRSLQSDLRQAGLLFSADDDYLRSAGMYEDWPQGRGIFVSADYRLAVWVNAEDHLRIITTHTKPEIAFHLAMSALKALQATLAFEFDSQLGYICPSPANLGTAMDVELHMRVDRPLTPELAGRVQENYGVIVKSARDDDSVVIARNELKVGITEVQTMLSVISGSVEVTRALRDSDESAGAAAGETKA